MSNGVDLGEFRAAFVVEAEELLSSANACLIALERCARTGTTDLHALRALFRAVHTIKGLSAMVAVEPIVELAHRIESVLRLAERSRSQLGTVAIDAFVTGVQAMQRSVRDLAEGEHASAPPPVLLEALDRLLVDLAPGPETRVRSARPHPVLDADVAAKLSPDEQAYLFEPLPAGRRMLRADFSPSPARAEAGMNITTVRARVAKVGDVVKIVPLSVPVSEDAPGGLKFAIFVSTAANDQAVAAAVGIDPSAVKLVERPTEPAPASELVAMEVGDQELTRTAVVRVDVARLDEAMERLSALVVTRFRLSHAAAALSRRGVDVRELTELMSDNARQLRELRAAILRVRMVRVADVFAPVPLLLRALTRSTGKTARLELDVGDAELDKSVADRLFPALVHLVRNAVDHGIEPPETRARLGKPEAGVVAIACFERSSAQLELSVTDDGGGIDPEPLARKAGRPVPTTATALLELLCLPGLSTRDEATATSGRGMGMDIVKRTIEHLGGELAVENRPGQGTRFVLRVPLTISIVEAFVFSAGGHRFVTPMTLVEEIVDLEGLPLARGPHGRLATFFERKGETVPLVQLTDLFTIEAGIPARKALVVRRGDVAYAFAVDRILGQQEIVVRPLTDPLVRVAGIAGSTDLGEGRPTLVLDLGVLGAARSDAVKEHAA